MGAAPGSTSPHVRAVALGFLSVCLGGAAAPERPWLVLGAVGLAALVGVALNARRAAAARRERDEALGRARAERIARAATEHNAMLLANLHDAVIGLDPFLVVTAWNPSAERIFGWTASEAIGRSLEEILPTEYAGFSSPEAVARHVREHGRARFDARRKTRSGEWVDVEVAVVSLKGPDGAFAGFVSVNRDVTARMRAERALRASQQRLVRILETADEGIWVVDAQARTEFANARMAALLGRPGEDLVGRHVLDLLPAELHERAAAGIAAGLAGEHRREEFVLRWPDGTEVFLAVSASALRGADGEVTGLVAVFTDMTAHHRAEEQLLHAQKMEVVGRLASGIAHDFNNLIVVIRSCSELLLEELPEKDPLREEAAEIRDAGERARHLTRQLLSIGRRSPGEPVRTDLDAVVGGFEPLLRRLIGGDVELSIALGPASWPVRVDPGRLEQVLANLVLNARDAMPEGGTVRVETANEEAPGGSGPDARRAVLRVKDEGVGMAPEIRARIFEPFFTTKGCGKGTGLGLSTSLAIVQEAGGAIEVESIPGEGTTFTVRLPVCAEAAAAEAPARVEAREVGARGRTVLVVDDQEAVRRVAGRLLSRNGFRVVEARSGAEALRRVEQERVDVVLSDVVMPGGMDGRELADRLRERGLPVLQMTAHADDPFWVGAGPFITKPFDEEELVGGLERLLAAERSAA